MVSEGRRRRMSMSEHAPRMITFSFFASAIVAPYLPFAHGTCYPFDLRTQRNPDTVSESDTGNRPTKCEVAKNPL